MTNTLFRRIFRGLVLVGGLGSLVIAGLGLAVAFGAWRTPGANGEVPILPMMVALELVALMTGGFAMASGFGKFRTGEGIALLCYGAAAMSLGVLSYVIATPSTPAGTFANDLVKAMAGGRLVLTAWFTVLATVAVLSRRREARGLLWRGGLTLVLAAVPLVIGRLTGAFGTEAGGWLVTVSETSFEPVRIALLFLGTTTVGIAVCVGLGFVIAAFDQAGEPGSTSSVKATRPETESLPAA